MRFIAPASSVSSRLSCRVCRTSKDAARYPRSVRLFASQTIRIHTAPSCLYSPIAYRKRERETIPRRDTPRSSHELRSRCTANVTTYTKKQTQQESLLLSIERRHRSRLNSRPPSFLISGYAISPELYPLFCRLLS